MFQVQEYSQLCAAFLVNNIQRRSQHSLPRFERACIPSDHVWDTSIHHSSKICLYSVMSITREDASCGGSCDTVSCMVAYSYRAGLLPSYPAKFIYKDTFPETQAKGEVCFWNMACSSCGATQEPL
ncbi:hypothetical protein EK904_007032, partial [Melospiza melodia maxima]